MAWKQPTCSSGHMQTVEVTRHKKERHGSNLRVRLQRNGIDAHMQTVECYSAVEAKNGGSAMCSDTDGLGGIMSSELSQMKKTSTAWDHLREESEKYARVLVKIAKEADSQIQMTN